MQLPSNVHTSGVADTKPMHVSCLFFNGHESDSDSDDDGSELPDIYPEQTSYPPLSTSHPHRVPALSPSHTQIKRERTPFVVPGDVQRKGSAAPRFNLIRGGRTSHGSSTDGAEFKREQTLNSLELSDRKRKWTPLDSGMDRAKGFDQQSNKKQSTEVIKPPACAECRRRKRRCIHHDSFTTKSVDPNNVSTSQIGIAAEFADTKEEEDKTKKRNAHARSLGLSMTVGAVDYRERKEIQAKYQERFAALIDADIAAQVDAEGGITPLGRLFKAGIRMFERNLDRIDSGSEARVKEEDTSDVSEQRSLLEENDCLREEVKKLEVLRQALRHVLEA